MLINLSFKPHTSNLQKIVCRSMELILSLILIYKMLVCVCVCVCLYVSCWFLCRVKSVWGIWGIVGTGSARGCCILSFLQFHSLLHKISCNCHAISHIFGYFSHFLANFNMLGIKMHVLKLWNSMGILSCIIIHSFTQLQAIFMQFHTILPISAIFWLIWTCWVSKSIYSCWDIHWWYCQRQYASRRG